MGIEFDGHENTFRVLNPHDSPEGSIRCKSSTRFATMDFNEMYDDAQGFVRKPVDEGRVKEEGSSWQRCDHNGPQHLMTHGLWTPASRSTVKPSSTPRQNWVTHRGVEKIARRATSRKSRRTATACATCRP